MAGFTVAVNNGSAEPAYYVDRLQRVQQQQHCQQAIRYTVQPSHVSAPAGKEILEPPRRDLVYVHCATTEEDEDAEEEEEEEPKGLTRSRSWLCCPADHSSDRTVPIQVEASHRDKRQESVSGAARRISFLTNSVQLSSNLLQTSSFVHLPFFRSTLDKGNSVETECFDHWNNFPHRRIID